jgi:hypothetical protein
MEQQSIVLSIPIVPKEGEYSTLSLSMTRILKAEKRGEEIAFVTPGKASELLATFNRAYLDASEFYARTKLEYNRAEDALNKVRAEILIDKMPDLLREKKIGSSADIRQAFIEADPAYQDAKEKMDFIGAMLEYLRAKSKYLENCFTSVKKIMDTGNWQMIEQAHRKELNGTDDTTKTAGQSQGRFGKAI